MEFAWNTQKNKLSDVKGKDIEQERTSYNLKNEDIDRNKTYLNYDLIQSDLNLYQRVKKRIDEVRENSRIQRNSVVMYSNVITVSEETSKEWGDEKVKAYFKSVTEYFQHEFGVKNVVSAKVHLDETAPHMHLQFVPVSSDNKLQAHKLMTKSRIDKIHSQAPKWLSERGFDVVRGKGKTGNKNIKDIYKYKAKKLEDNIKELEDKLSYLNNQIVSLEEDKRIKVQELEEANYTYQQNYFYIGQINDIRVEEIEEGIFNKTKTNFVKVHKNDFNKLKEFALKTLTKDTIKSYTYKDIKRLEEANKYLENEIKEVKNKYVNESWENKRLKNTIDVNERSLKNMINFIRENNLVDSFNDFINIKKQRSNNYKKSMETSYSRNKELSL